MTPPHVAVIGAGPAGSTAARLLAARGAEVALGLGSRVGPGQRVDVELDALVRAPAYSAAGLP